MTIDVGAIAPDFSLQGIDGKTYALPAAAGLQGRS